MGKDYKQQASYDYLHGKPVKGKLLRSVKRFFNNCNFPKHDGSRQSWYRHKNRNTPDNGE